MGHNKATQERGGWEKQNQKKYRVRERMREEVTWDEKLRRT